MNSQSDSNAQANMEKQPEMAIQRLYTKDLSLESPSTPALFREQWQPELQFDVGTESMLLEEDVYEVCVRVTATVKSKDKVAFLVEVKQAGIFTLRNFDKEQMPFALNCICPAVIFPYAREVVSDISVRAGFPPLILAPINFEALNAQQEGNIAGQANSEIQETQH